MTINDNSIDINEDKFFLFYHGNRLLIVGLSALGLSIDGYQISDIFFGSSIVLWVWLPELEIIEKKIINFKINIFFTVLFRLLCFHLLLGVLFMKYLNLEWASSFLTQSFPEYITWVFPEQKAGLKNIEKVSGR